MGKNFRVKSENSLKKKKTPLIDFDLKLECGNRRWALKQRLPIRSDHLAVLQMACLVLT